MNRNIDSERKSKKLIYTDCMLLVQMLQGGIAKWCLFGWKHTSNADLLKQIDGIMRVEGNLLTVVHVYAHTGKDDWKSKWNAEADLRQLKKGQICTNTLIMEIFLLLLRKSQGIWV